MLSRQLGIGVGISSGANFIGCVKIAEQLPDGAVLVTVFSDDNNKHPRVKRVVFQMRAKPFVPRGRVNA